MSRQAPNAQVLAFPPGTKMLEAAEVAERLNMSLTSVYRLARSGRIKTHRHGQGKVRPRGLRFPEPAVADYLSASLIAPEGIAS